MLQGLILLTRLRWLGAASRGVLCGLFWRGGIFPLMETLLGGCLGIATNQNVS